ncbi:MAG: o-succinylbenzoate--CoA ligase [Candidatus Heimdallarchaeota archaeon]|nr:o-succinylbenzoate--CoA ligase [Candidatus Heimdallarchaeota archaeon]
MEYWLFETAKKYPERVAVLGENVSITYAELLELVISAAHNLTEISKPIKDTKIAILLENRLEYIILIHAFATNNLIPVLINTRLTKDEIMWQLTKLETTKIIVSKSTFAKVEGLSNQFLFYSVDEAILGTTYLSLKTDGKSREKDNFSLDKVQSMVFTSGTTGKPKAAVIRFSNLHASALGSATRLGVFQNDIWMLTIPLYHVGGLSILIRSCLNGTTVFLDNKFKTEQLVELINQYHITIVSLVPTMLQWLINYGAFSRPIPTLRLILLGGDRTSKELIESCKKLNLPIATTYGMTETVSQIATAMKTDIFAKPMSVGRPLKGIKVTIVNDKQKICDPNEVGEIIVSGNVVVQEYYDESSDNIGNNKFKTGDIGYMDHDGDLFILQRRVDLIISGGENIYPSEIEDVISKIDGINSNCVIGVDDAEWGQVPVVAVILQNDIIISKDQILKICSEFLAPYKVPRIVYFMNDFPRNSLGKINRKKLLTQIKQTAIE